MIITLKGIVQKNLGRGKELGYPTANIPAPSESPEGIFVGYVTVRKQVLPALIFIGPSITFDETDKKAEIYILDFDSDIYDETIYVEVREKLRDNIRFDSTEELIVQMQEDEENARNFFKKDAK